MNSEYMIKKESKSYLANNVWGKAIAITMLVSLIPFVFSLFIDIISLIVNFDINLETFFYDFSNDFAIFIDKFKNLGWLNISVSSLLFLLVVIIFFMIGSPLKLGVSRFYYMVSSGESPSVDEILFYFKKKSNYIRSLSFGINMILRLILFGFLSLLPGVTVMTLSKMSPITGLHESLYILLILLSIILIIAGLLIFVSIWLRYFLVPFLIVSQENSRIYDCIDFSFKKMSGFRMSVIKLYITFIPLLILNFFVLPILYVIPYLNTSRFVCAKWLKVEIDKQLENHQVIQDN